MLLERDSETGVFLRILQNFQEHLFLEKTNDWLFLNKQKHQFIVTLEYNFFLKF